MIFTIGYGNRKFVEFLKLLWEYKIKILLDVRSQPYSSYNLEFSKNSLIEKLKEKDIKYSFWGKELGGKPSDESCYVGGKVDYSKIEKLKSYQMTIDRLVNASKKNANIVLMCSEEKPENCHRSKLIGESLLALDIELSHIDEGGKLKTQSEVMNIVSSSQSPRNLFGELDTKSRKKYK